MDNETDQPIIVIGMHRSGTTLVAQIMSELGVDMGRFKDQNHEPWPYISMNNWILLQAGTSWEYAESISRLTDSEQALEAAIDTMKIASTRANIRFTHAQRSFPKNSTSPWGWKDPRNTATLPIWLGVYPKAKIVYVKRHGVPVASSLITRLEHFKNSPHRIWHKVLTPIKPGPAMGSRLWTLSGCLEMWSEYQSLGEAMLHKHSNENITIEYETLLNDPDQTVKSLANFINNDAGDQQINAGKQLVRSTDPFAFRKKPELAQFELNNMDMLKKHGYS